MDCMNFNIQARSQHSKVDAGENFEFENSSLSDQEKFT